MDRHQEVYDEMTGTLTVLWTVTPTIAPQPQLACSGCNAPKPFRHTGKMRVNANGKNIDAWLIYNCTACDTTWNRPILERRNIRAIDPAMLQAFQANDVNWVEKLAFDTRQLRRHAPILQESSEVAVHKKILSQGSPPWVELKLVLRVPFPTKLRLDRLLAYELGISRSRILNLKSTQCMRIGPDPRRALRRPVRDGTTLSIGLYGEHDGLKLTMAAAFER